MAKKLNVSSVADQFFTQGTDSTQETQKTQTKDKKPPVEKEAVKRYRFNLNLEGDLEPYLRNIAWQKRTSVTQIICDLIRKDQEEYLKSGGSTEGWQE